MLGEYQDKLFAAVTEAINLICFPLKSTYLLFHYNICDRVERIGYQTQIEIDWSFPSNSLLSIQRSGKSSCSLISPRDRLMPSS